MSLPLGRANTTHSARPRSNDLFENIPVLSPGTSPHSGTSFPPAQHLSPALALFDSTDQLSVGTSPNSSAMNTPLPSRSPSPLPPFYSAQSSGSDTDSDEPGSPLLLETYSPTYSREGRPRWWPLQQRPRRGPRRPAAWGYRYMVRVSRRVFRHPFFPKHPSTIVRLACLSRLRGHSQLKFHEQVLSLLFFTVLAISITFLLIHLLNPDKEPLPWRAYCTRPETSTDPPPPNPQRPTFLNISTVEAAPLMPPFPPSNFEALPPAGVFVGVFSTDSSSERRMLIRSAWASHPRSRNGAGVGDGGAGTSRTIVRFIMGQPRKSWERRVRVEMEGTRLMPITCAGSNPMVLLCAVYRVQRHCHSPNTRKHEFWQDTHILYLGGLDGLGSTALF